ncbi:glutathione S-transferase family protein [Sphingobium algorifonticola]|uniref:Glutathione S-transferase family protein n=1 Tax=Sphingobium algorifonticola TaxID=2008318 RepID=A0A437JA42_9SPHN|nr:glutathione S-transferase family protein [Sphingobium algorifonticola]RVT42344.1 glutathione S-transferase family protein [Sphingobium algorifonticola]
MITLYGPPHSRAFRVQWMLRELGLAHDMVPVDFFSGAQLTPEYRAINPNGRVPALSDDNGVFWESLAINLYLARRHGGPLAPDGLVEESQAVQWALWAATEIETPLLVVLANNAMFLPEHRDDSELETAIDKLSRPLSVLASHLDRHEYLLADRFTVADLNVASIMAMARLADMDLDAWPTVDSWLTNALNRPAAADYHLMKLPPGPRPPHWQSIIM